MAKYYDIPNQYPFSGAIWGLEAILFADKSQAS